MRNRSLVPITLSLQNEPGKYGLPLHVLSSYYEKVNIMSHLIVKWPNFQSNNLNCFILFVYFIAPIIIW